MGHRLSQRFERRTPVGGSLYSFNGSFANLFAQFNGPGSVLQVVQTDLGLTYGGTLLATGTTPPVITLTGTLNAGLPVTGFTISVTLGGALGVWTGLVTYLRDNSTQAFTSAATVPLTGAGAGLTLNIAAGAAAGDNVWKATCSALADQSGNAKDYSQGTAFAQPLITIGLNGKPGLLFDGVNDLLVSTLNLPAPGTTPTFVLCIVRQSAWGGAGRVILSSPAPSFWVRQKFSGGASPDIELGNSTANTPANNGAAIASWVRIEGYWSNSASDYLKAGATKTTAAATTGNASATSMNIGGPSTAYGNIEFLAAAFMSGNPSQAQKDAMSAAAQSFYGPSVGI